MAERVTVYLPESNLHIPARRGDKLLEVLRVQGVYVPAICGGTGRCGSCRMLVNGVERRACRVVLDRDCTVHLPKMSEAPAPGRTPTPLPEQPEAGEPRYAFVADIGTTTVALQLLSLPDGAVRATVCRLNPQRGFGGDVISRIDAAAGGHLDELCSVIRGALLNGMAQLLTQAFLPRTAVERVCLTGNTAMLHLLLGLPCDSLGADEPTPATEHRDEYAFAEVFGDAMLDCVVELTPWLSATVGGDAVAALTYCLQTAPESRFLLLDLGTNSEISLYDHGNILMTATSAGPAFEGGNIGWGVGCVPGAVCSVRWENDALLCETIAGAQPVGLSGAGAIDLVACLRAQHLIDTKGAFPLRDADYGVPVANAQDGTPILFLQQDVRALQLAKATVRSGVEILLREGGLSVADIGGVYLTTGGYKTPLNAASAATIGLLPTELAPKTRWLSNAALAGCARICADRAITPKSILASVREVPLAGHHEFGALFQKYMPF